MKTLNRIFTIQRTTLFVVAVSTFMLPLDFTVVSVALHDIQMEFNASFTETQWIVNGYTLLFAALLMAGGTMADRFGRKKIFVSGISIFMISSLTCGLALTPLMLSISRGFQGMGAALMFSAGIPLLVQEFTGSARAKAFGIFGMVVGTGAALGPLLGGIIIKTMGWRWAFLINVPVGLLLIILILWKVRETKDDKAIAFDFYGFMTFTLAILSLVYSIIMGNDNGWGSPIIFCAIALAALSFLLFIIVEKQSAYPMFDLSLFTKPSYIGISLTPMLLSVSFWGMFLYTPMYFQSVLGYTPLQAGAGVLPFAIPLFVMGPVGARLTHYLNSRTHMALGILLVGIGALLLLLVPQGKGWLYFMPGALIAGMGNGLINGEIINVAMALVPAHRSGMASGITGTMRQLGVALGFAGLGAIFSNVTASSYNLLSAETADSTIHNIELISQIAKGNIAGASNSLPSNLKESFITYANTAFYDGFHTLLWCSAFMSITGAVLIYMLIPPTVHSNPVPKK
jgi:EmrB/QacA subfamily drug resistance transporter